MSGSPVTTWNNYMEAQGPLYVNGPNDVYNDAQLFKTWSTGRLMGGSKNKRSDVGVGGSEIRFSTFFETGQVTKHVMPGETRVWSQPQKLVHGSLRKRYRETHMSWTRQIIMDNEGIRNGNFDAYVNHRRHLEQVMQTDYWNFDEDAVWKEPNYTEMESGNGTEGWFYSVPAFINEYTNGLYNKSGTAGTAWTTIHGLDPTSTTRGQNRYVHSVVVYSNEITSNSGSGSIYGLSTILTAMEKAWMEVDWRKPPKAGEYFDDVSINNQTIFCSPEGQRAYSYALRVSQDVFVTDTRQDSAYNNPTFNGIPMHRTSKLTTAPIYPADGGGSFTNNVPESTTNAAYGSGPRYYFIDSNTMFPFYDPDMFFERGEVRNHFNDPDTFVQPIFLWGNLMCPRRSTHCLIRPGGSAKNLYLRLYS